MAESWFWRLTASAGCRRAYRIGVTTEVFFDDMRILAVNLLGEEGKRFPYILSGMNAKHILIAAECALTRLISLISLSFSSHVLSLIRRVPVNRSSRYPTLQPVEVEIHDRCCEQGQ